jgi:hypothetical protein
MPPLIRIVLVILFLGVAGFCVFGFLACFEPGADPQHVLKVIYCAVGVCCLALTGGIVFRMRK